MNNILVQPVALEDAAHSASPMAPRRLRSFDRRSLRKIPQLAGLPPEFIDDIDLVARVFPFKVNDYVLDELIDWSNIPDDPIYRLTFPHIDMLSADDAGRLRRLIVQGAPERDIQHDIEALRSRMNPHPADQRLNAPRLNGRLLEGLQHKYRETVLFFPSHGQTCHTYCTFCFRWPQFVGDASLKIAANDATDLHDYLRENTQVTDLLLTGGDPMVMNTKRLREYLAPLMQPEYAHLQNIRIGTKALTYWPHRFVTDRDADDFFALLGELQESGKSIDLMAHLNHWRELTTEMAVKAIRRLRGAGVVVRSQGPVLRHVNDSAESWRRNWTDQVQLGISPYYMFVERDTGPRGYFEIPLARALDIYRSAFSQVSGLARTARGPSMSSGPGKVEVTGTIEIDAQQYFVLNFLQARDPAWTRRPFLAKYSPSATWLDQLEPPDGEAAFFFEAQYRQFIEAQTAEVSP